MKLIDCDAKVLVNDIIIDNVMYVSKSDGKIFISAGGVIIEVKKINLLRVIKALNEI